MALIAACLSLFINYIIGKPGGEFSPYEILSGYTVWLSRWRLKRIELWSQYNDMYSGNKKQKRYEIMQVNFGFDSIVYNAAEPFFTWERAVGMCVVCTGFWISLAVGLVAIWLNGQSFLSLVEIIVFSHIIIRILAKII